MSLLTAPLLLLLLVCMSVLAGHVIGRQRNSIYAMAVGGTMLVALTLGLAIAMHTGGIPIRARSLAPCFAGLGLLLTVVYWRSCRHTTEPLTPDVTRLLLPGLAVFSILILPYTHFTGIDTYKWQDLATAMRMEQNIPWLMHPLSILGFTPRSYPSAQPILLGTIQILANLGVDAGFAVLSIFIALLGGASAYLFGRCALQQPRDAAVYALLYVFAPVFTRYAHWATGRGLFLALLPLFLAALLKLPRPKAWVGLLASGILLAMSHKVGLIVCFTCLPLYAVGFLAPSRSRRITVALGLLPSVLLAILIVPRVGLVFPLGNAIGLVRFALTRFGWLMPVAFLGLIGPENLLSDAPWKRLFPLMLLAIPLAFERHMYGALVALPLITLGATLGVTWVMSAIPSQPAKRLAQCLAILTLAFTVATIIHRSKDATPRGVYQAAQFLERQDPQGPLVIHAPGMVRTQIQAYASGCPRFNIHSGPETAITLGSPPPLTGHPRDTLRRWTNYMRGFLSVSEMHTDWYGESPRHYYVVIAGQGACPPNANLLYSEAGVQIFTPAGQDPAHFSD